MTLNAAASKAPAVIHIQGRATVKAVAERAKLDIRVSDSGFEKEEISKNVVAAVNTVQSELDQLCSRLENGDLSPNSPITFFSTAALSISTGSPYEPQPEDPTKKVYTAESIIEVHFRDFSVLGKIVGKLSLMKFVGLNGIQWQLTDAKEAWLEEEVRMQALKNAIERADAYALIIGRQKITCTKIDDVADRDWPNVPRMMNRGRRLSHDNLEVATGIHFEPGNVELDGSIRVEFHAE